MSDQSDNENSLDLSFDRRRFLQATAVSGAVMAVGGTYSVRVLAAPPMITLGQIAPMTGSAAEQGCGCRAYS